MKLKIISAALALALTSTPALAASCCCCTDKESAKSGADATKDRGEKKAGCCADMKPGDHGAHDMKNMPAK